MIRAEKLSRVLVVCGLLFILAAPIVTWFLGTQGVVMMHGRMAESGGWTPDNLQAQVGVPLHLRLTSDDVTHGFAIGQNDMPSVDVLPGKMADVTVTFDKPGTYTFYCTRWCGVNHWRMRGKIEVSGSDPSKPQPAGSPLYMTLGLNIDAAHPAVVTPVGIPDAQAGATFSSRLPANTLTTDYYRSHSPDQAYQDLRANPTLSSLDDSELWNLIAYIWQSNTTPAELANGQKLFARNCAACHGEAGGGDGVFATKVQALTGKSPAKFADSGSMLGASPALLQGKLLRGGMGTSMPSWGPILTDQQTWDIISFLYTFQFKEKNQ
jgi:mono/diheme cytochrome c family protein/plastocyanin